MKKLLILVAAIGITTPTIAETTAQELYKANASRVHLLSTKEHTESDLSRLGKKECAAEKFCLIWYFDEQAKSKVGIERMKAFDTWDPVPGLIGIYS